MVAQIAVSCAVFAMDQPYSYRVPQELSVVPGMRVVVPFGRANRRTEGIVLAVAEADETKLKPIEQVLDEQAVMDEEQLRLAAFIRERYFCTYYDAVKAILPAGLWFRQEKIYRIRECADRWQTICAGREPETALMELLQALGGSAPETALLSHMEEREAAEQAISWLLSKKLVEPDTELTKKPGPRRQKFAAIAAPEEAVAYCEKKRRTAPVQAAVLELLGAAGECSCRELTELTGASASTFTRLEKLGLISLWEQEAPPELLRPAQKHTAPPVLNDEQQAAFDGLLRQMELEKPGAALLYGVTGSGKTAIYISLIYQALQKGKGAILLVPEIALTPQLLGRLSAHFGEQVAVLHSSLRVSERFAQWRRIRSGNARVVVGTRSAIFAPVQNPGLFILDEEQEHTYKSENSPRYHAREIALYRGAKAGALVLLSSATPSVESMYRAKQGDYSLYRLSRRYNEQALPETEIIDLKQEIRQGNATAISLPLEEKLRDNIIAGRQSILFLNRRGNSRYLVCVECGEVPTCPRCSVHLTYHSVNQRLVCHYCGYSEPVLMRCPKCAGALKPVGWGTQKIEQELRWIFPDTEILRMDADTISAQNGHEQMLRRFEQEKIPILLGTQMVSKGLDFENVTLVGVLDADMSLYVSNYRAAETTFSLITQVVGRAGRGEQTGAALIQTMTPEHPVIRLAARQDYDAFYEMEIAIRELHRCPPFADLFFITFTGLYEDRVMQAAGRFRDMLRAQLKQAAFLESPATLLGPAPCAVAKINYTYRYRLTLAAKNSKPLRQMLASCLRAFAKEKQNRGVNAYADVNSYD
mgnify:CR=1 FL=1